MLFPHDMWTAVDAHPTDFVYKLARTREDVSGFWRLRRTVFCDEQGLFDDTDTDERDAAMIPIVCVSLVMGMEDEVVGVVRIHEHAPGIWWGSRLAVSRALRRRTRLSLAVTVRNHQPPDCATSIGAGLIYKAVSTARALGCRQFDAHVQQQNAPFFRRMHWTPLVDLELHGRPHVHMRANLQHYPPASHDVDATRVA